MQCEFTPKGEPRCTEDAVTIYVAGCYGEHFTQIAMCAPHGRAYDDRFTNHLMACGECVDAVGLDKAQPIKLIHRKEVRV